MRDDRSNRGKVVEFESDKRRRAKNAVAQILELDITAADVETVTDIELNEVKYPQLFKRRYGFHWPLSDRLRLLFFQKDHGLKDTEIRLLKRSGNIRCRPDGLILTSRVWMAWLGWVHIGVLVVVFGPLVGLGILIHGNWLGPMQWLALLLFVLGVSSLVVAYYFQYIEPWRIQERLNRRRIVETR